MSGVTWTVLEGLSGLCIDPRPLSLIALDTHSCEVASREDVSRCWYSLCRQGLLAEHPHEEGFHDRFHLMKTPRTNPTIDDRWNSFWRIIWVDFGAAILTYGFLRLCERCPRRHYQRAGGRRYSIRTRPCISYRRQQVAIVWSLFCCFQLMHCQLFNRHHGSLTIWTRIWDEMILPVGYGCVRACCQVIRVHLRNGVWPQTLTMTMWIARCRTTLGQRWPVGRRCVHACCQVIRASLRMGVL